MNEQARPVSDLVKRLGPANAMLVVERVGGQRIAVPASLENDCAPRPLAKLVGSELAILLVLHFGGSLIYVPRGSTGRVKLSAVVRLTRKHKTADDIARKLKCSNRTVYAHRAKARELGLLPTK